MRLEKIKLAGFKSFVDPTTIPFPSDLVGVVGPNGCGKSNVIDAVRWVMGESSAKMLRGESMADVIFNGSSSRKPVGTASIELLFDNGDGSAGGEYARFTQIAVKRQVARDGQSTYFLNGSRCRRRDVHDLFLGTGLGPRSYAIIEQGMITRLIEARPEELRLFLEEAAGISKYKERRRETENRMRHTRDNLDRLNDLRDEVSKQLQHLERQAATAERYQRLKADERRLEAELKALRWRVLDEEIGEQDRTIGARAVQVEEAVAAQRRTEAEVESQREAYSAATDAFNEVQGRYYAAGSEIARIEQAIQFAQDARARQEAELERVRREQAESGGHLSRDEERLEEVAAALARNEPELEAAEAAMDAVLEEVAGAEEALKDWEAEWDAFNRAAAAPAEQAQVARTRINHLEQTLAQDEKRLARLADEHERLDTQTLEDELTDLHGQEGDAEAQAQALKAARDELDGALAEADRRAESLQLRLDETRTALQEARGRRTSLVALQEAARGDPDEGLAHWLAANGLAEAPRLLDHLEVEPGWERAAEVVLGERLRAVCTDDFDGVGRAAAAIEAISLFDTAGPASGAAEVPDSLLRRVRAPWPLGHVLSGVGAVTDLDSALARRAELAPGEYLVTQDGVLVGANWLYRRAGDEAMGGALARAEELKALDQKIAADEAARTALTEEQDALQQARRDQKAAWDQAATRLDSANQDLARLRAELAGRRTRLDHQRERRAALAEEREELATRRGELYQEIEDAREGLHELLEEMEALAERREALSARREGLREALTTARAEEGTRRERAHALRVAIESHRSERQATQQSLARARERRDQLSAREAELGEALAAAREPLTEQKAELEHQLAQRVGVEEELRVARERLDGIDAEVRALERRRQSVEQEIAEHTRALDAERLARQERLVRRRTLEEQLAGGEQAPETILEGLDPQASEAVWQEELTKVGNRIQRLGAINLAAIDEFREQSERLQYLDAQHGDITQSLETLEQAIRKIDRETRSRFKETYDQVNQGFGALFPRLFGGGQAYLELTGDDLLETGVGVMARPPGKRNTSIHLLSGGEKALTAVALVFAIFQLNPAPFCLLDEVDAPLDETNVGRFCDLLRAMSKQVQFIFITHNKVTMEAAEHLLGVTMHEPGVSRLVSVAVEEAVALAAAS